MSKGGRPDRKSESPWVGSWLSAAGCPPAGFAKGTTPGRAELAWSVRLLSDDREKVRNAWLAGAAPAIERLVAASYHSNAGPVLTEASAFSQRSNQAPASDWMRLA